MTTAATARIVVLGNSGGGKSTLARRLAASRHLPLIEADALLWRPGWQLAPLSEYQRAHAEAVAGPAWIFEGLGRFDSILERISRATEIVLVDMPLDVHIRLATERHTAWEKGTLPFPPAMMADAPRFADLLANIHDVDRTWMPDIRRWVADAENAGVAVTRIASIDELERLGSSVS
ncbi:MAG TPA: hypothetical protein VGG27_05990 [Magnetospirillaceae bacterium]|jgi:hypothetical protein